MNYKKSAKEKERAAVALFNGISIYGEEIPLDDELLPIIRAHYERKLREAEAEFKSLGERE